MLVSTVSFLSLNRKFVTKRSYWVVVADDSLNLSKDGNYWLFNLALKITFSICRSGNISDKGHYFIIRRIQNRLSRLDYFLNKSTRLIWEEEYNGINININIYRIECAVLSMCLCLHVQYVWILELPILMKGQLSLKSATELNGLSNDILTNFKMQKYFCECEI